MLHEQFIPKNNMLDKTSKLLLSMQNQMKIKIMCNSMTNFSTDDLIHVYIIVLDVYKNHYFLHCYTEML